MGLLQSKEGLYYVRGALLDVIVAARPFPALLRQFVLPGLCAVMGQCGQEATEAQGGEWSYFAGWPSMFVAPEQVGPCSGPLAGWGN